MVAPFVWSAGRRGFWGEGCRPQAGAAAWTAPLGGTYYFFALAFDGGKLFVNNFDGTITAFNPSTGGQLWSVTTGYFSSEPVARKGVIYVYGAGTVYAVSEKTGATMWTVGVDGDGEWGAHQGQGRFHLIVIFDQRGHVRWQAECGRLTLGRDNQQQVG